MSSSSVEMFSQVREKIMGLREITHTPGVISPSMKMLISSAIFTALRCEPCIKAYVLAAQQLGAKLEEVVEVYNLVINAQGCVGDVWAARSVELFKKLQSGAIKPESILDELCETLNPERVLELLSSLKCC